MLKSKVARLAVAAATIASAVAATSLGTTGASAATAHTATTASSAGPACYDKIWFNLKTAGLGGGSFGFFLTDEGHNNLVETTGTGTQWCLTDPSVHNGKEWDEVESRSSGECLNVVGNLVYMDSCVNGADSFEHFLYVVNANGYAVLQNFATHANLTADGLFNGSFVYVTGGPANGENQWVVAVFLK